jgi:hypothetical protein
MNAADEIVSSDVSDPNRAQQFVQLNGWIYCAYGYGGGKLYRIRVDGSERQTLTDAAVASFLINGDRIIYTDIQTTKAIYSMRFDGSEKTKIADGRYLLHCQNNSWLYGHEEIDKDGKVYQYISRMRPNGTEKSIIAQSNEEILRIFPIGDDIFYSTGKGNIYKCASDGGDPEIIMNDIPSVTVYRDQIFYFQVSVIYRINIDGSGMKKIDTGIALSRITNIVDGQIYFMNRNMQEAGENMNLYKMSVDGGEPVKLAEGLWFTDVEGNWIYYQCYIKDPTLYRVRVDGTGQQVFN